LGYPNLVLTSCEAAGRSVYVCSHGVSTDQGNCMGKGVQSIKRSGEGV